MSSVMSIVSTIPADRVTVSSCQGSPEVVTLKVVERASFLVFPHRLHQLSLELGDLLCIQC